MRSMWTFILFTDIDLDDPETEKAATKIQAVFRGHRTRQTMKSGDVKETVQDLEAEFNPNDQGRPCFLLPTGMKYAKIISYIYYTNIDISRRLFLTLLY